MTYTPESPEEAEYLANYDPTKYEITINTVDVIVHTTDSILLIKRGNYPYKGYWALPGGFVNHDETTFDAAARELAEETTINIDPNQFVFQGIADKPNRDPRGHAVSFVYSVKVLTELQVFGRDDATDARWFSFNDLPSLAFDHAEIIGRARPAPVANDFSEDRDGNYITEQIKGRDDV